MKNSKLNIKALSSIRPEAINRYLELSRWKQVSTSINDLYVWRKNKHEIILPTSQDYADYPVLLESALNRLAKAENILQSEILNNILESSFDIFRLRAPLEGRQSGLFPVSECVSFYNNTYDLLISAASSVVRKDSYFKSRKPRRAEEYIQHLQFAIPEPGSYIIKVLSPVDYDEENSNIDLDFSRKVLRNITSSVATLNAISSNRNSTVNNSTVDNLVESGINGNICKAIVGLAESSKSKKIGMNVTLASIPGIRNNSSKNNIIFQTKNTDVVTSIGNKLIEVKETQKTTNYTVIGKIVALERPRASRGGSISVKESGAWGTRRKVKIELDKNKYKEAVKLHGSDVVVRVQGKLYKDKGYELRDISVITPSEVS